MVGQRHGFDDVKAEFSPMRDFKVRWERSYNWAVFTVSDYLDRAPDEVLQDLAEVVFSRITGEHRDYGDVFLNYVTDRKLTRANRRDFLKRSRNLSKDSIGEYHDLNDCVNRLRDMRLIPDDLDCVITWDDSGSAKAAGCSLLQVVVWVNKALDTKGVPEQVLDYSVYSEMCHLIQGFNNNDEIGYRRLCSMHPIVNSNPSDY